jgi:hypothetical protein
MAALAVAPALAAAAPSPLEDNTAANFAAGTLGTSTWAVEPGSVRLKPSASENFDAPPPGWTAPAWTVADGAIIEPDSPPGGMTVDAGTLVVDGARAAAADVLYDAPQVLEFRATFTSDRYQHVGFGQEFKAGPWAMFSTGAGTAAIPVGLYARTLAPAGEPETEMRTLLSPGIDPLIPHTYRIEWVSPTEVRYYVDDDPDPVATHTLIAPPNLSQMRPVASDLDPGGGVVKVDWVGMGPYPASASFESRVLAADAPGVIWGSLTAAPAAGVTIETRSGDSPSSLSTYEQLGNDGAVKSPRGQYIQYRATLMPANKRLEQVAISYEIDTLAPNATTIAGVDVSGTTATLRFANTDADVARFECKLDGGDFAECTSPKQFTGLAAGSHTASVRAIDKAGNAGQAVSQAFTVATSTGTGTPPPGPKSLTGTPADTKPPLVTIAARSIRVSKRAAIRLKCPADETKCTISVRLKYGRKTAGQKTVTVAGGKTVKANVLLSTAARTLLAKRGRLNVTAIVTARDAAGNSKRREFAMTLRPV